MIDTRLTPISIFISCLDSRFDDSTGFPPLVGDWHVLYSKLSHWPYVFFPRDGFSLKSQTFLTTDLSFSPPRMMMPMMILFRWLFPILSPEFYFGQLSWSCLLFSVSSLSVLLFCLSVFARCLFSVSRLELYLPSRSVVRGFVILMLKVLVSLVNPNFKE